MKCIADLFRKTRIHYAWVIMIACVLFYGATTGTLYNVRGIFYSAICEDTGWNYSVFSISTIVMGLTSFAVSGLVNRYYSRFSIKRVLFVACLVYGLSFMARGWMKSVAAFNVLSIAMGAAAAFIIYVPVPLIINNWFIRFKGLALGCATLASGLGAMITSPIYHRAIESMGWQRACIINGLVSILISLPAIAIFIFDRPEDIGLKPLGWEKKNVPSGAESGEKNDAAAVAGESRNANAAAVAGECSEKKPAASEKEYVPSREAQDTFNARIPAKRRKLLALLCVVFVVLGGFVSGYNASLSNHALSLGLTAAVGAAANSLCSFTNMLGKVFGGVCADRFGLKKTASGILILSIVGMIGMIFGGQISFFFYMGAFFVGLMAFITTSCPAMMLSSFCTGDEYLKNVVNNSKGIMLTNAFVTFLPGILLDISGSNTLTCILYAGFLCVCLAIMNYVMKE